MAVEESSTFLGSVGMCKSTYCAKIDSLFYKRPDELDWFWAHRTLYLRGRSHWIHSRASKTVKLRK